MSTAPAAALAPARRAALAELLDAADDYARIEHIRARLYTAVQQAHPYLDLPTLAGLVGVTLPTVQRIVASPVEPELAELGVTPSVDTTPLLPALPPPTPADTLDTQRQLSAYLQQLMAGGPPTPTAAPAPRRAAGAAPRKRKR